MTKGQLHILQHSLGLDEFCRGREYRNHYTSQPFPDMDWLVDAGYMVNQGDMGELSSGMNVYTVTDAGRAAMFAESPKPPKLSRSQKRYQKWLQIADCFPDWKYGDFIKNEKKVRQWEEELRAREDPTT